MKIKSAPIVKTFALKSDVDKEAKVTIRQATFEDSRLRSELFARTRYIFDNAEQGQFTQEQDINTRDMEALEIYLTLCGAEGIFDEGGTPYFTFTETTPARPDGKTKFLTRLGALPEDVVREIHTYVREVNPQWGAAPTDAEGN